MYFIKFVIIHARKKIDIIMYIAFMLWTYVLNILYQIIASPEKFAHLFLGDISTAPRQ